MKKNISIFFLAIFTLVILNNCESNSSNLGKVENHRTIQTVSVCRNCQLVVEWDGDGLFPDNKQISTGCNYWEGHSWYNAGTSGSNRFKCTVCQVEVSIFEKKPRCLAFCEMACNNGEAPHQWIPID